MSDEKHAITALLEQAEFALHGSRPFGPAERKHIAHMTAMTRQQDIRRNHTMRAQPLLNLRHISLAAIQAVNQQSTYDGSMVLAFLWHIHRCHSFVNLHKQTLFVR